ncbi:kinase-like domain, phloem protein 2-like protein [Tanacetum coccineum]
MPMFRICSGGKKFPPILLHRMRVHDSCAEGRLSIRFSAEIHEENVKHLRIPVSEIESATKKYLGSGTYGKVYAADLEVSLDKSEIPKKRTVAIKCIEDSKPGKEGFYTEIELLTSCKHPNIVSLLGFCNDGPNMILVFEYASNKSLDNYLGGSTDNSINLTWIQRLKICIDIARGLNYLHTRDEDDEKKIVHRDLKGVGFRSIRYFGLWNLGERGLWYLWYFGLRNNRNLRLWNIRKGGLWNIGCFQKFTRINHKFPTIDVC